MFRSFSEQHFFVTKATDKGQLFAHSVVMFVAYESGHREHA